LLSSRKFEQKIKIFFYKRKFLILCFLDACLTKFIADHLILFPENISLVFKRNYIATTRTLRANKAGESHKFVETAQKQAIEFL